MKRIWFTSEHIYIEKENGDIRRQSLLWYPALMQATDEERNSYTIGYDGLHWRKLDVDLSFESFDYEDAEPSAFQRFFLTHPELNLKEFCRRAEINPQLLGKYIHGMLKPTKDCEEKIMHQIHLIGTEYQSVAF
ncbi:MAG: DUF2442 domain-containing protein [Alloprevotella sp.]